MPEQKLDEMTWWEKVDWMRKIAGYPASSILIFTRTNLGYRFLKPTWFLVLAIALTIGSVIFPQVAEPYGSVIRWYGLAMVVTCAVLRWKRWKELRSGFRWHSFSPGISYLEKLPFWPNFMLENRRINRFVEPPLYSLLALLVSIFVSHGLGSWLMVASCFVFVYEQDMFEKNVDAALDALDGILNSEVQAANVAHFSQTQPEARPRQLTETAGIPTGLAPDIHRQVKLRRAKRMAAQEKLAKEAVAVPA